MSVSGLRSPIPLTLAIVCTLSAPTVISQPQRFTEKTGPIIRGRIVDPHQLRPEEAVLMLGRGDDRGGFSRRPVPTAPDGSFTTSPLSSGKYVLEIVRTPHSATKPETTVGFKMVEVGTADITDVRVEVRRDTALIGRFRMESDNPKAEWPPHMVVNAFLAVDGMPMAYSTVAEGAMGGKFVLRNAFGPRVLRCGYSLAPESPWWPSSVSLDGRDITNVPTDFSEIQSGQLEVVFTQHPAEIAGGVVDVFGQPVRTPWILVNSTNRTLWQPWATTSHVIQGNTRGEFSTTTLPGEYRVTAVPLGRFENARDAREELLDFAGDGVTAVVKDRAVTRVKVTLSER